MRHFVGFSSVEGDCSFLSIRESGFEKRAVRSDLAVAGPSLRGASAHILRFLYARQS